MGVYGYGTAGVKIPEGYLRVRIDTDDGGEVEQEILYPANPGSVYHMTKTQDQLLFAFYNKNDGVRVTDLHQGIVWGTQTAETRLDERLINRFDYDGDYGTVLNRFLMQAAIGYPLTVHGTGGQTRAFIHIQDTVRCIELAIENPPEHGRARAHLQPDDRDAPGHRPRRARVRASPAPRSTSSTNPRKEAAENDLYVENRQSPRARARPDHARGRPAHRGHRDRAARTPTAATARRSRAARSGSSARSWPHRRRSAARAGRLIDSAKGYRSAKAAERERLSRQLRARVVPNA